MVSFVTRTGDNSVMTTAKMDMSRTSEKIQNAMLKIDTGKNSQSFQDSGEFTPRILNLEGKLSGLKDFEHGETTVNTRLQKMELVVRQINDIAIDFNSRLRKVTSFGANDTTFQNYCSSQLKEVGRLLNSQDEDDRYIFGGTSTLTAPVDMNLAVPLAPGDPISKAYYLGTSTAPSALIGEGQIIDYGITGDTDAFANLINALATAASTGASDDPTSPQYQVMINQVMPMVENASNQLPDQLEFIGVTMKMVEQSESRLNDVQMYTEQILDKLTGASFVDSMMELNMAQVALQVSILAHQKLNDNIDEFINALRSMH